MLMVKMQKIPSGDMAYSALSLWARTFITAFWEDWHDSDKDTIHVCCHPKPASVITNVIKVRMTSNVIHVPYKAVELCGRKNVLTVKT